MLWILRFAGNPVSVDFAWVAGGVAVLLLDRVGVNVRMNLRRLMLLSLAKYRVVGVVGKSGSRAAALQIAA